MRPSSIGRTILQLSIIISLIFLPLISQAQSDVPIKGIIGEVSLDSLLLSVRQLTGDTTVILGDSAVRITTRRSGTKGNNDAAAYLMQRLLSFGLDAREDTYSTTGKNIIALQMGREFPGIQFMICAHYDSFSSTEGAPGADDNASGAAAVLETARILSKRQLRHSVAYALWDEEEDALVGSRSYARRARERGDSIQGVINIDMIGCDVNGDSVAEIHSSTAANSLQLASDIAFFGDLYAVGPLIRILPSGSIFSDHSAFWVQGYSAVLLTENDFNANEHMAGDVVDHFTLPYFHMTAKLAIGALAALASVATPTATTRETRFPARTQLFGNFPNPFNGSTTIRFALPKHSWVNLTVHDITGQTVRQLVYGRQDAGYHEVQFHGSNLASGVYLCRMQADGYVQVSKIILLK